MIKPQTSSLTMAIFVCLMFLAAQALGQIVVLPSDPSPGVPFQIEVTGTTGHSPAIVTDPIMQIDGSTILLQVTVDAGPWAMVDTYTHVFDIPPIAAGTYVVEFWENRIYYPVPALTLIDTLTLQLFQNPVPMLSASMLFLFALMVVIVAFWKISR